MARDFLAGMTVSLVGIALLAKSPELRNSYVHFLTTFSPIAQMYQALVWQEVMDFKLKELFVRSGGAAAVLFFSTQTKNLAYQMKVKNNRTRMDTRASKKRKLFIAATQKLTSGVDKFFSFPDGIKNHNLANGLHAFSVIAGFAAGLTPFPLS